MAGDGTLTGLLATAPTGKGQSIYYQAAWEGAPFPFVIFGKLSGVPTYSMKAGEDAFENEVWLIKGVDRSDDTDPVEAIQTRLKALLTDATVQISGRAPMLVIPIQDVDYSEPDKGTTYRHAGIQLRLIHQPT